MSRDIEKELVEDHGWDPTWFKTVPESEERLIARHDEEHANGALKTRPGRRPHTHPKTHKVGIDINMNVTPGN